MVAGSGDDLICHITSCCTETNSLPSFICAIINIADGALFRDVAQSLNFLLVTKRNYSRVLYPACSLGPMPGTDVSGSVTVTHFHHK